jgi:hypothetical protein
MALDFPATPVLGQRFPVNPGTSGVSQWSWDGTKWNTVPVSISLGSPNQAAYNDYQWPAADGTNGYQLTTDGVGNLTWTVKGNPSLQVVDVDAAFDGVQSVFGLVEAGTTTPFTPSPSNNIVVFLGGVPQTPAFAYTIVANTIIFTASPLTGSTFYAISTVIN